MEVKQRKLIQSAMKHVLWPNICDLRLVQLEQFHMRHYIFEFETLYSTDVSLMYIRANASASGACMYIRRSANINAQN